ncbi:thiamine pyrophosphate-dependent dehydrogenase E1 component subunit alpha [Christensenellaceae bacterium OttesenSCG-928-M15]|nr:thiamine pyrophosphate-dependent dehydrogenase E1 component subunit alpha [Christensenellaceae bacterium OttesenSCG-928-M15]
MEYNKTQLLKFFETMCNIRYFEESVEKNFLAGRIPGFVHLYINEEAIATGVCGALKDTDYIESTHRGHGHCIAKGANIERMMAEIYGKQEGLCKGKGGSMHIADFSVGMLGANGVVGGGFNLATGAALSAKLLGKDDVSVVFFGDGASNRGTFHEAANMASAWKLPVIFALEMNCWASTTPYRTTTAVEDISDRAAGYNMPREIVDGSDVMAVYEATMRAVERARNGEGPTFLEFKTYRVKGHFVGDPEMYRTREEVQERFETLDPLKHFRKKYVQEGAFTEEELDAVHAKAKQTIADALAYAEKGTYPDESELFNDLYI